MASSERRDDAVGVALIGCGRWGRRLATALQRSPLLRLMTCYSRSAERRDMFAREFNCHAASSFLEAIEHPDVDGVLLVTPNYTHAEQAIASAKRGKHLFVEKPIADTLADAQSIIQACSQAGVTLLVGHAFRRLGAARRVKALIDEGRLGTILLAEANFSLPGGLLKPGEWRYYRETCPGGPLMQLGIHHVDTLQYWLGPVRYVWGSFDHVATEAEIDDVGIAGLSFAHGQGTVTGSYLSRHTYYLRLFGSDGNLHYETDMTVWPRAEAMDTATTLRVQTASGWEALTFEPRDMLVEELEEFARCIRGEATPETGATEALRALEVVCGALISHERGDIYTLQCT